MGAVSHLNLEVAGEPLDAYPDLDDLQETVGFLFPLAEEGRG